MIGLGMDGKKLKMVLHVKGIETDKWLNACYEMVEALSTFKKEPQEAN